MRAVRYVLIALVIFFGVNAALGDVAPSSAMRGEREDWLDAAERSRSAGSLFLFDTSTPEGRAVPVGRLDSQLGDLPEWTGSMTALREAFFHSRDERYYDDGTRAFLRRSSWMYPDDGCFSRAGHVAASLERKAVTRPGRVFGFGNLRMATKFNSRGAVYWWYHVAAAYRVGRLVVVFDPSVHHDRPLLLEEWIALISRRPETVTISLCDTHAYMTGQICVGGSSSQERSQMSHQKTYLRSEFTRLDRLGYDATATLRANTSWGDPESYSLPAL